MKKIFSGLMFMLVSTGINAQEIRVKVTGPIIDCTTLDAQPQYPEGKEAFNTYVVSSLKYMKKAKGKIHVSFSVEEDGSVTNVMIIKGIEPEVNKKVMEIIEKSKKWIPAHKNNVPSQARVSLAINLKPN